MTRPMKKERRLYTFSLDKKCFELLDELKELEINKSMIVSKLILKHLPTFIEKYKEIENKK